MNMSLDGISGAQSIARALSLLKMLSQHHERGADLTEMIALTRLNRTTVYRLLCGLAQGGYVERNEVTKRYHLGLNAMQLGLTAMTRPPIVERCRPLMRSLARSTEDTVFLIVRNGDFAHCLHLERGPFPVRVMTTLTGSFRLLGLGTAGQALLATLTAEELKALYNRHAAEYERNGMTENRVRKIVERTRCDGYSTGINLLIPGVHAVGVAFELTEGHYAALSIAAIASRLDEKRRRNIAENIRSELNENGFKVFPG
ncbi:IclR family transcriptional regulator [Herbaspirillum sp. GCM10030257]|uniref:IclR family transcriptional regulator n=1 Tax=Herbaspirillum sp. GCM10030257 TaxID=3273393 RepID=UPI003610D63E